MKNNGKSQQRCAQRNQTHDTAAECFAIVPLVDDDNSNNIILLYVVAMPYDSACVRNRPAGSGYSIDWNRFFFFIIP